MKEAGSGLRTAFHQDAPYFPFSGLQCAICWVPATIVRADDGRMGYVRGSHKVRFESQNARKVLPDSDAKRCPFGILYHSGAWRQAHGVRRIAYTGVSNSTQY